MDKLNEGFDMASYRSLLDKFTETRTVRGLLLSWDSSLLSILQSSFSRHLIWIKVLLSGSINIFNIINLYAPQGISGRLQLWYEVKRFLNQFPGEPFCVAGDFNCIRSFRNKENCDYRIKDTTKFWVFHSRKRTVGSSISWFDPNQKK